MSILLLTTGSLSLVWILPSLGENFNCAACMPAKEEVTECTLESSNVWFVWEKEPTDLCILSGVA